ncbi:MAG: S8 family serine peptidase, partial [Myxococcota bacterium]
MRKTPLASAGLLALVAGLCLMPASPDRPIRTDAPPGVAASVPVQTALPEVSPRVAPVDAVATSAQIWSAPDAATIHARTYFEGQRLVRLADPMKLPDVAARYGVEVVRPAGRSGYAVLEGEAKALAALSRDPSVESSLAHARIVGASDTFADPDDIAGAYTYHLRMGDGADEHMQWYIDKVDPPLAASPATDIVVAVLDTGVAYETAVRDGQSFVQAPSLAGSQIVAPYDFVNDDAHANDDHQHGTHIASIIASNGDIKGTAPGVSLMPIKVLDHNNMGSEYSLIEGIWWAVQNQASILNMSLSFGESYAPSQALLQALQAASDAGILMVA